MAIDMEAMLAKIKDRQWVLADIDWDAPGADMISDEQRPQLKAFMADLCRIENIGARGFAALAKKAPTPTIAEIYRYFHAEEQRHANAELALMKRWGMLTDGEIPEPNVNIRLAIDWLDHWADDMPLSPLGTVIPMLEVALDGALLKFLLDEVHDPICHQVFEKINNDESRHLVVDFEVLDMIGYAKVRRLLIDFVGHHATPGLIIGAITGAPLINRIRNEITAMGMEPERLYRAVKRFKELGDRGERTYSGADLSFPEALRRSGHQPTPPLPPAGEFDGVAFRPVSAAPTSAGAVLGGRTHPRAGGVSMARDHAHAALIIAAGFTGLGAAIRLAEAGVDDIAILERSDRVGGTWRDTTYPGASCDVPSLLYSYSFVKNPTWSRTYSPAPEIYRHLEDMADRFDIRRCIRFGARGQRFGLRRGRRRVDRHHQEPQEVPRPHRGAGVESPVRRQLPRHPWAGQLPRAQDPQRALGPRLRLRGQAGRGHRDRRQRHPDHPRTGQAGRVRQGVSAHTVLGAAAAGRRHPTGCAGVVRESPCRTGTCPPGAVLGPQSQRHRAGVGYAVDVAGRPARKGPPVRSGEGSVAAPSADAGLSARLLQAHAGLQRLLHGAATRQLQAHRLADRHVEPGRHSHQ